MRNLLILAAVVSFKGCLSQKGMFMPPQPENPPTPVHKPVVMSQDEQDFRLICLQEGHGRIITDPNDKFAFNKEENAIGPAQITPDYLTDANGWLRRHGCRPFTHKECYSYQVSFNVCKAYWAVYDLDTLEKRARCHCGGPDGMEQTCTLPYWHSLLTYKNN